MKKYESCLKLFQNCTNASRWKWIVPVANIIRMSRFPFPSYSLSSAYIVQFSCLFWYIVKMEILTNRKQYERKDLSLLIFFQFFLLGFGYVFCDHLWHLPDLHLTIQTNTGTRQQTDLCAHATCHQKRGILGIRQVRIRYAIHSWVVWWKSK